jgi:signal transduction histidine kinase
MADTIVENIKKLKQKDMLRRELSANISHDLRSPLASIEGYIETILMKEESIERKERKKYLHVTLENLKLLNGLVEELFELSNLDAKQVRPKIESFSLTELTQDVNMKLKPRANDLEVDLVPRVPEKLYFVKADIGMIERVMTNLLDNALKYSPAGSSVIVRIDKRNEQVRYSVSDSGPGISEEDLPFIFDRYFTGTRGHGRGRGGSGLGLAISKKILELHGSMIRVNCGKEKGCTFYFELPVLPSNP